MEITDEQIIIIQEYVKQLENNVEHLKEQCLILETQKSITNSQNKQLRLQIAHLQIMLSNPNIISN